MKHGNGNLRGQVVGTFIDSGDTTRTTQGVPPGRPSRAQDCSVIAQVKWRDTQVWKRKWALERPGFAAEYSGILRSTFTPGI
jgi:hypothetical protein